MSRLRLPYIRMVGQACRMEYWREGGYLFPFRRCGRAAHRAIVRHRNRLSERRVANLFTRLREKRAWSKVEAA